MRSAREGDFIETTEHLIFDVKGLVHPKTHIIAFLRYFPDAAGTRLRNGVRYKKVYTLEERYQVLKEKFPHYLYQDPRIEDTVLQAVPQEYIWKVHRPQEYLSGVLEAPGSVDEEALREFVLILQEASKVSLAALGVSGSFLVGVSTPQSDLDIIAYGSESGRKVYEGLAALFQTPKSPVRPYRMEELKALWEFRVRDTPLSFEEFVKFEQRKRLQGKFEVRGRSLDFYVRLIKDWEEVTERYSDRRHTPLGTVLVEGTILSEEEALFTPCRYPIALHRFYWVDKKKREGIRGEGRERVPGDPVREVISYRGRFCEAYKGAVIQARGTLERVEDLRGDSYLQVVVGNHKLDFLKICDY